MMLFIVNPISGKDRKQRLISHLQKAGYKVVCTEYAGHAEKIARETEADVVVAETIIVGDVPDTFLQTGG